ncbi:MAG: hypothetical protein L6R39_005787 [Caloplaca ligustica]|nr:MAG: hypothetical protein L6R39_005787 [Caloplaca ligustica]
MGYDKRSKESPTRDNKHPAPKDGKIICVDESGEGVVTAEDGRAMAIISLAADCALSRKFDLPILPGLIVVYFFNSLDKSDLGKVKTNGLEKTFKLKNRQYNKIPSVFFVPYGLREPLLAFAEEKYGPNRVLHLMMFCFCCFTIHGGEFWWTHDLATVPGPVRKCCVSLGSSVIIPLVVVLT